MDIVVNANKSYEDVKCWKCFNSAERSKCQVDNRDNYNGGLQIGTLQGIQNCHEDAAWVQQERSK